MTLKKLTKFSLTLLLSLLLGMYGFAQQRQIRGTVTDDTGQPIAGVTVTVKGSTRSVVTNAKGTYDIPASADETLVFSHIAFAQREVKVGEHPSISIQLNKGEGQLDNVIVIGYGTQRLKNVTGAVNSINMAKIADQPVATITEALRGQVPGMSVSGGSQRPGDPPNLTIRQQFNWGKDGGNTNPLIIIDDVIQLDPQTGWSSMDRFNLLDPSEVESITVLRDGASAIYGFRAAQGAIIVKTKRGKTGPPKINYSGKFETDDAVSHGKVMNAYDYGVYANRFGTAAGWLPSQLYSNAELENMKSLNYDWLAPAWKPANLMQHSLTVSGGADRATYFLGGSYYTQGANMGSQNYNRYTFRGGTDVTVASGLKLSATIAANSYTQQKSFTKITVNDGYAIGGEQNDYNVLLHMPKYIPWIYNVNGVDQYVSPILSNTKLGTVNTGSAMSGYNYYAQLNNGNNTNTKSFGYNANFSAAYEIPFIQGLSVKMNYAIQSNSSNTEQDMFPSSLVRANNTNTQDHHLIDSTTTWDAAKVNTAGSRITYSNTTGTIEQINFFLNYDRNFGNHGISAVVSGEREKTSYDYKFLNYSNPLVGGYNGTSVSAGTIDPTTTQTLRSETGTLSYLGRVSYNYKSKYLFQFLFRADANSKFAPANYWGFFPTVSAGWVISDEDWFKNAVPWVNFLKLRGSYGITGNDNVKPWKWEQLYNAATAYGMGFGSGNGGYFTNGIIPDVSPNPDIKWDRNLQRNIGIDLSLLNNRLTLNIDHYENSISNMLTLMTGAIGVPISAGGAYAEQNYAAVKAWGTEITATWKDKIANKVDYTVSMNFGTGDNKTTKYFDQPFAYQSQMTTRKQVGQSNIFPQWGFRTWKGTSGGDGMLRTQADMDNYWAYLTNNANKSGVPGAVPNFMGITSESGLKKGMLVYEDVGGVLDAVNQKYTGPNGSVQQYEDFVQLKKNMKTYGIATNLSFSYMGISLSAQLLTSWGGWNRLDYYKQATGSSNMMWAQPVYLNNMYDSASNPNGKYPNLAVADSYASDFFQLPSFRMYVRTLSVGYALPKKWVTKARMESARVYLTGNNLWDLYNPYPNHYRNMYDSPLVGYPTLRTWAMGVNLGF
jgi:TonB-linked SusC/RagA family outer membrane protein